jgi:hypothetical protein
MIETRRKARFEVAFVMIVMMMVPAVTAPSFAHVLTISAVTTRTPPTIKTRMHVFSPATGHVRWDRTRAKRLAWT